MIEELHTRNLLHKNIGPEAFCFGTGYKSYQLMMTCFQHATPYRDNFSKNHIPYREDLIVNHYNQFTSVNVLSGLGRYASLNPEYSRRDDLESLGYLLLYFLKPKSTLFRKVAGSMHPDLLYERKVSVPVEMLCNDLPSRPVSQLSRVHPVHEVCDESGVR